MTAPHQAPARPFTVTADAGVQWLVDLLAYRDDAKARLDAAKEAFNAADAAVKTELTARCPQGTTIIDILRGAGYQALRLAWRTPTRFNRKRFARDHPDLDAAYTEWGTPHWEIRALGGPGGPG